MIRIFSIALASICLIWPTIASSQVDSVPTLTLDQCLAVARANNPILRQAGKSRHIAELARKGISTTAYPQVSLQAGGVYAPVGKHFGYDPVITSQGQLAAQVFVEQSIYDGGIRGLKKEQADIDIKRLTQQQQLVWRELEFNVTEAFIEALKTQSEIAFRIEGQSSLTDYYLLVKSLHTAGTVGYTDLLSTQSRLLSDSLAMAQAAQTLTADKLTLADLLGATGDTSFALAGNLDSLTTIGDSLSRLASFDSLQNLELSIARLNHKSIQYDIRLAKRESFPTLSLIADAGYLSSRENLLLTSSDRKNGIGYEVGFALGMPIFDWGGRKLRVQQLSLISDSIQTETEILKHSLLTEFHTALAELSSARKRLHLTDTAIMTATDYFDLTEARYAGGTAMTLEVLDAFQSLTDARLSRLDILAEIATLDAKIQRIIAHE